MIFKSLKWGLVSATGAILVGGLLFGRDLVSYVTTGAGNVRSVVKDSVPIEFELQRVQHMVDDILPELRSNIRVICREKVEVEHLRKEIEEAENSVEVQRDQLAMLRDRLSTRQVSYEVGGRTMPREQVVQRLKNRLDRFSEAQAILDSKQQLLHSREKSLAAAEQMLEKTQAHKVKLEQKIQSLVAKHRLVKAQAATSEVRIDNSQLARADRLMTEIEKRLDTAQRVIEHESNMMVMDESFDEPISEDELLAEVDAQLGARHDVLVAEAEPRN